MRLIIIIVTGIILIGATYMWSSASSQQPKPIEPEAMVRSKRLSQTNSINPAHSINPATSPNNQESKAAAPAGVATSLEKAREEAKAGTINKDPFAPLAETESFPTAPKEEKAEKKSGTIPPPPKSVSNGPFGDMPGPPSSSTGLVPPPPPNGTGVYPSGLSLGDLPMPPEKPSLAAKVTLISIVGQRAIFEIRDGLARRAHGWPRNFTLGPGEEFDGMKVITVKNNEAIVEEHGETMLKELPPVR